MAPVDAADLEAAEQAELEQHADDDAGKRVCPECGEAFDSNFRLGLHRRNKHGVPGQSDRRKRERKAAARGPGRPKGSGESRVEKRRRLIRETLLETVELADEARGRSEAPAEDLADVIRRDADRIAYSLAWVADKLVPFGTVVDFAFGRGGVLTVARGFSGVGRWVIRRWRTLLAERQAAAEAEAWTPEGVYGSEAAGDGGAGGAGPVG